MMQPVLGDGRVNLTDSPQFDSNTEQTLYNIAGRAANNAGVGNIWVSIGNTYWKKFFTIKVGRRLVKLYIACCCHAMLEGYA